MIQSWISSSKTKVDFRSAVALLSEKILALRYSSITKKLSSSQLFFLPLKRKKCLKYSLNLQVPRMMIRTPYRPNQERWCSFKNQELQTFFPSARHKSVTELKKKADGMDYTRPNTQRRGRGGRKWRGEGGLPDNDCFPHPQQSWPLSVAASSWWALRKTATPLLVPPPFAKLMKQQK